MIRFNDHLWLIVTFACLLAIAVLSLAPLPALPATAGSDKTHHLLAYAVLMLPTTLRQPRRWWLLAVAFAVYGGVIELLQPMVNRHGDWRDLLANLTGLLVGMGVGLALNRIFRRGIPARRSEASAGS